MDVSTVTLLYGLAALVGVVILVWLAVMFVASRLSPAAGFGFERFRERFTRFALVAAWVPAFLAMLGSLYFSEIAHYTPCTLCWYQRIAMYPLVIILAMAAARRERAGAYYAGAIAGIGALVSAYHVVLEWVPALDTGACSATTPCTLIWFRVFGFISLPTLALSAFVLILTLLAIRLAMSPDPRLHADVADPGPEPEPEPDPTWRSA